MADVRITFQDAKDRANSIHKNITSGAFVDSIRVVYESGDVLWSESALAFTYGDYMILLHEHRASEVVPKDSVMVTRYQRLGGPVEADDFMFEDE